MSSVAKRMTSRERTKIGLPILALVIGLAASAAEPANSNTNTLAPKPAGLVLATNQPASDALSPVVTSILKMADAGVSMDVIKAYVENAPAAMKLNDADLIALKRHNISDDVSMLLLKRAAQARTALAQAKQQAAARAASTGQNPAAGLDPESYEYFQYYYLQPRALASANQQLLQAYYPPFPFRSWNRPGLGFWPGPMYFPQ